MEKKHIIALIVAGIILLQTTLFTSPILDLVNPSTGKLWEPSKYANIPTYQKIKISRMKTEVKVIYDKWGVPHIFGENFEDVFRAFGYIQARDRLFQMDLIRRMMEGKLSEILGPATYETDVFYRTLGISYAANKSIEMIRLKYPEVYSYVEAFSEGVNYYIVHEKMPLGIMLLNYKPKQWTPVSTLEIAKFIEWGLTGSFWDIEKDLIFKKLGNVKASEIFPMIDYVLYPILKANETIYEGAIKTLEKNINIMEAEKKASPIKYEAELELLNWLKTASHLSDLPTFRGSNNWVVSGKYTKSGKPLLANDPHLQFTVPPIWYEAHLVVYNKMNVRGVTFPGIPFIIIGHNDKVAWGVTNVGADVIDYYYYVWKNDTAYYYNDTVKKVEQRLELIEVAVSGGTIEKRIIVNSTVHGPIFERNGVKFAMKWTGLMPTYEAVAVFKYNIAKNITDFIDALKLFNVPGQNLVYADVYGNIMYYPSALYPIRKNLKTNTTVPGDMPFNGSDMEGEWVGFIPFEEIPHAINLPRGYIVTANNRPDAGTIPYYWGDGETFADPYRAMRITQMIKEFINTNGYVDIDSFKEIQGDIYSIPASKFIPYLLNALNSADLDNLESQAKQALESWDYKMLANETGPTIFIEWLYLYRENIFKDEYEMANLTGVRKPKPSTIEYMTEHPNQFKYWFDNKSTTQNETRDDIIVQSFREAVKKLAERLGSDVGKWKYGKIHIAKFQHPLGSILDWLNYKAVPANGGLFTPNPGYFNPSKETWYLEVGPSWREIIDLSNFSNSLCIIPGGQSGNPYSKHYDDQFWLWINIEYKAMTFPNTPQEIDENDVEGTIIITGGE
ncbi:MAG: penicillin acylase family protein [Candidatus Njordarchaeia archaeon]